MSRALTASRRVDFATLAAIAAALAVSLVGTGARAAENTTTAAERTQLEKDLGNARERLDDAARDVAELTRKLYGDEEHDVMRFIGGPPSRKALPGLGKSIASHEAGAYPRPRLPPDLQDR